MRKHETNPSWGGVLQNNWPEQFKHIKVKKDNKRLGKGDQRDVTTSLVLDWVPNWQNSNIS